MKRPNVAPAADRVAGDARCLAPPTSLTCAPSHSCMVVRATFADQQVAF